MIVHMQENGADSREELTLEERKEFSIATVPTLIEQGLTKRKVKACHLYHFKGHHGKDLPYLKLFAGCESSVNICY